MLKVAFIGDSYASYVQKGQGKNSWTYLLAKHFPQHQYYNYAIGGRGYDFYQICLLDAKIRNIDVILINKTFSHRVSELHGDDPHSFTATAIDDNYAYVMVETYNKPIHSTATIEINFSFALHGSVFCQDINYCPREDTFT